MRIFFLAYPVSGLYMEIEKELRQQGHEVYTVIDRIIRFDPYFSTVKHFPFRELIWKYNCKRYWDGFFKENREANAPFDLLLLLSGCSASDYFISLLKGQNTHLRVVLYTWDGCSFYSFDRHMPYVDRAFTFDIEDANKDKRWTLLPIYCRKPNIDASSNKIDLFMVGSNHDGRCLFVKKLLPQLKKYNLNYYIRIFCPPTRMSVVSWLLFYCRLIFNKTVREEFYFPRKRNNNELLLKEALPPNEYDKLQNSASCILDDQREGQSGLTARFMWALADKKKIITTNKWAYEYDFVSKKQVVVISKSNPILPLDFIKKELKEDEYSNVSMFELDKWVHTIIDYK